MSRSFYSLSVAAVTDNQYGNLFFFTPERQRIDRCQSHVCLTETEPWPRNNHRGIPELADFKSCRGGLEGEVPVSKRKQFKATSPSSFSNYCEYGHTWRFVTICHLFLLNLSNVSLQIFVS